MVSLALSFLPLALTPMKYAGLIFLLILAACQDDIFTTVEVTYAVKVKAGNTVTITCNNDYYFDTGIHKPIVHTSTGSTFFIKRLVFKEEPYYIRVNYTDSTKAAEDNYRVQVFYNDTIQIQSLIVNYAQPTVTFEGIVKEL
ncbi:MAG: hypothetical protein JNK61_07510 [Bacteroidia bacterium]|nr:hypothetical protein [Bacteroidia bacterium]